MLGSGEGESAFQWRDEYSVGVQGMDLHHRRLLSMASRLQQRLSACESTGAMKGVLDFLIRYSEFHFSGEEDLMGQYGYPGLDGHLAKHRDLAQSVLEFREKVDSGDAQIDQAFVDFLKDWVVDHVLSEDRKYGPFLNERGVY